MGLPKPQRQGLREPLQQRKGLQCCSGEQGTANRCSAQRLTIEQGITGVAVSYAVREAVAGDPTRRMRWQRLQTGQVERDLR